MMNRVGQVTNRKRPLQANSWRLYFTCMERYIL